MADLIARLAARSRQSAPTLRATAARPDSWSDGPDLAEITTDLPAAGHAQPARPARPAQTRTVHDHSDDQLPKPAAGTPSPPAPPAVQEAAPAGQIEESLVAVVRALQAGTPGREPRPAGPAVKPPAARRTGSPPPNPGAAPAAAVVGSADVADAPPLTITIGQLVVRPAAPVAAPSAAALAPQPAAGGTRLSLEDYLRGRRTG